jgi:thioredoxin reductase (NADPH)
MGNGKLQRITMEHLNTGNVEEMDIDGAFIFVGYKPNTESLKTIVKLNTKNEIITDRDMKTNIKGVFAAGDCIDKKYRQVTTAVAEGTIAALSAVEYIKN